MPFPSIMTLESAFPGKGKELRAILDGSRDPEGYTNVSAWVSQCHNKPSTRELQMCALNQVLGTHGVEAIEGRYVDRYHYNIQAVYCNAGDTYDVTILLDHENDRFIVTSWGDWVERNSDKREIR